MNNQTFSRRNYSSVGNAKKFMIFAVVILIIMVIVGIVLITTQEGMGKTSGIIITVVASVILCISGISYYGKSTL